MKGQQINREDSRLKITFDKRKECFNWGDDNKYPSLVKDITNTSFTAKQCVDINAKYLYGKGFVFTENVKDRKTLFVNKKKQTIDQLFRLVTREFAEINNFFLHVNYNGAYEVKSVKLIPSTDVRIGAKDSEGYNGKYLVYDNWDKSKGNNIRKVDFDVFDRFNPDPKVIQVQVDAQGGWNTYKGQIIHVTSDFSETYALSDLDSVLLDADSQYQAAIFKNKALTKGFFGQTFFLKKPSGTPQEEDEFVEMIREGEGAQGAGGKYVLIAQNVTDNLEEQFIIKTVDTNIDDKMFAHTEGSVRNNIRTAYGIPSMLLDDKEGGLLGDSGQLLDNTRRMHWDSKEEERQIIQETFETLFSNLHTNINPTGNWDIIPIISTEEEITQDSLQPKQDEQTDSSNRAE